MNTLPKHLLIIAGVVFLGLAAMHLAMIPVGPPAYEYFGPGSKLASLAWQGSPVPDIAAVAVAVVFVVFAAYAFSGAGMCRPLPGLAVCLRVMGALFVLRGMALLSQLVDILAGSVADYRGAVFSSVSMGMGLLVLLGSRGLRTRAAPAGSGRTNRR